MWSLSEVLLMLNETGIAFSLKKEQESAMRRKDVMAVLPTGFAEEFNFSVVCQCNMRLTSRINFTMGSVDRHIDRCMSVDISVDMSVDTTHSKIDPTSLHDSYAGS